MDGWHAKSKAGEASRQPHLITLACRFVPHDQWLTTHVDPAWKIKEIKLWILGRCLGTMLHGQAGGRESTSQNPSYHHDLDRGRNASTTEPSAMRHRAPSPITFAADPRRRPISPIMFAKTGKKKNKLKNKTSTVFPHAKRRVAGRPADEYDDIVGGYEEDDEWDSSEEAEDDAVDPGGGGAILPKRSGLSPSSSPSRSQGVFHTSISSSAFGNNTGSKYNIATSTYTIIRFSTGQTLEDDFQLSWYDLAPNELLELHAHQPVQYPPPSFVVAKTKENSRQTQSKKRHSRNPSSYSTSSYFEQLRNSDTPSPFSIFAPANIYYAPLDRSCLSTYIQPYWEGYVRVLRVVWREEPVLPDALPVYDYAHNTHDLSGLGGILPGGDLLPDRREGKSGHSKDGKAKREGKHTRYTSYGSFPRKKRTTKLEWRLRWAIIREGQLHLSRNREDVTAVQVHSLSSLMALRGADHLAKSASFARQNGPLQSPRRRTKSNASAYELPSRHKHDARPSSSHNARDSDLDSDADPGLDVAEIEGEDLKVVCIKFRNEGKARGSTSPAVDRNVANLDPKKYSSTIGYGAALMANSFDRGSLGTEGMDVYAGGDFPPVGPPATGTDGEKSKTKKSKEEKRGHVLRKTSFADAAITYKNLRRELLNLDSTKDKDKGSPKTVQKGKSKDKKEKEKERDRDWAAALGLVWDSKEKEKDSDLASKTRKAMRLLKDKPSKSLLRSEESPSRPLIPGHRTGNASLLDDDDESDLEHRPEDGVGNHNPLAVKRTVGHSSEDEDNADADLDKMMRSDSPLSEPLPPPSTQGLSHLHRHPLQTGVVSVGNESEGSLVLTSPVFRHDDSDVGDAVMDDEQDDDRSRGRGAYRYGYRRQQSKTQANPKADDKQNNENDLPADNTAQTDEKKGRERAEWIILDMGTDLAYASMLRILHRHFPAPMSSSFVSAMPSFSTPTPPATPTPTPTPLSGPASPTPSSQHVHWSPSAQPDDIQPTDEHTKPFHVHSPAAGQGERPPLTTLSDPTEPMPITFGTFPYPEWRVEIVQRAQKAGMGNVGQAMRWVLWQNNPQLAQDIEDVQKKTKRDEDQVDEISLETVDGRDATSETVAASVGSPSESTIASPTSNDLDIFGKDIYESDSEIESSEAEWHGWVMDLFRQQKLRAKWERKKAVASENFLGLLNSFPSDAPQTPAEERLRLLERRRALEPVGVVTTVFSSTPPSSSVLSTPATTLYSPSSFESLARRERSLSFSTDLNAPGSPSPNARPTFQDVVVPANRRHRITGSTLFHSASMHGPRLRSSSAVAELGLRRPSMPILSTEQATLFAAGEDISTDTPAVGSYPPTSRIHSNTSAIHPRSPSPPAFLSPFTGEPLPAPSVSTTTVTSTTAVPISNSIGRISPRGSFTLAANMFSGLLRKDVDKKEQETKRVKEKRQRAKDKKDSGVSATKSDATGEQKPEPRPKLSIATPSNSRQKSGRTQDEQRTYSGALNVTATKTRSKLIMRRVRSGSSLVSPEESEELTHPAITGR